LFFLTRSAPALPFQRESEEQADHRV